MVFVEMRCPAKPKYHANISRLLLRAINSNTKYWKNRITFNEWNALVAILDTGCGPWVTIPVSLSIAILPMLRVMTSFSW